MYKDKEKQKDSVRQRQDRVRKEFQQFKEKNPCADCGNFYPYYVMQFDHVSDKKFTVSSQSASFGSKRFMKELKKCDLVCANCHAIRTFKRRQGSSEVVAAV